MQPTKVADAPAREFRPLLRFFLMQFIVFIGGLLLAVPGLGMAQSVSFPPRAVRDSAFAVHQLFKKHRHSAEGALGTGAASIVGMVSSSAQGQQELVGVNALVTVAATIVGLRQAFLYSSEREQLILRQYEQGWSIPPKIRRRLKTKYFKS